MKHLIFICILSCSANAAFGQLINPPVIYQDTDIALHDSDVYYAPFAPPLWSESRGDLSCIAHELNDLDGVRSYDYAPVMHGMTLAPTDVWMRLFTANDKPSGAHSDIIAGGYSGDHVIVSKNEDVDFRATGTIKLKNGFHVKPGAFFHAYIAPKFDTTVFADEFTDTSHSQWAIPNGHKFIQVECSSESNVHSGFADTGLYPAHDGYAMKVDIKEETCSCNDLTYFDLPGVDDSSNSVPAGHFANPGTLRHYEFSAAAFLSNPFPFDTARIPLKPAYQNAPYGKWEIREKIPNFAHHTNNFGDGQSNEWNLDERYGSNFTHLQPGLTHRWLYGPFKGKFTLDTISTDTEIVFRSRSAHFANWNKPYLISVNNFGYEVSLKIDSTKSPLDTILMAINTTDHEGKFPSSLTSFDSVTFYYSYYYNTMISDKLAWSVDGSGTYFTGPYAKDINDSLYYFTKSFQPKSITLSDSTYPCHWDHSTGKIYLTTTLDPAAPHSDSGFSFTMDFGPNYPVPPYLIDTSGVNGKKYHTYGMEFLPHEARFLYDGHVMRRFPDRLIPTSDQRWDYVSFFARTPMNLRIAETDIEGPVGGIDYNAEKAQFESEYGVGGTTSHYVDYFKIWDLPAGSNLPHYPH